MALIYTHIQSQANLSGEGGSLELVGVLLHSVHPQVTEHFSLLGLQA